MRRLLLSVALVGGFVFPLRAQVKGVRFEITAVGDTTLSFAVGSEQWVRPGLTGIAVDPKRRDALVARFRIVGVSNGIATAVVTAQTADVAKEHAAILDEPSKSLMRSLGFWGGVMLGFIVGAVTGSRL